MNILPNTLAAMGRLAACKLRGKVHARHEARALREAKVADLAVISAEAELKRPKDWGVLEFSVTRNNNYTNE